FRQHDRNAVADREGELGAARDQLLPVGVVFERPLGQRADQDFQQLRIDRAGGRPVWRGGGHRENSVHALIPRARREHASPYCNGGSPSVFFLARSISVMATRISARVFRSGASSSACFSAAPNGDIMARAFTSASFGAFSMPSQSVLRLLALRNADSAAT